MVAPSESQLHPPPLTRASRPAGPEPALGPGDAPITILIAEDDPAVRALLARILRARGYAVVEAANGLDAVAIAEGHGRPFQLLLTDVVMPRLNGIELAARLLAAGRVQRVIFMTGYADVPPGSDSEATVLYKPFTPSTLVEAVRTTLGP
jgi:CheY-like chemotaxis protein